MYRFVAIQNWPGKPTAERRKSHFKAAWSDTLKLLERELNHLDARNIVIQADCDSSQIRLDGMFRAGAKMRGPGIILTFDSKHGQLSYPCDTFLDWADNLRAIALSLENLRAVDRYGVTRRGEQYSGWARLPGPPQPDTSMTVGQAAGILTDFATTGHTRYQVASSLECYQAAARSAKAATHPDRNAGSQRKWDEVQKAIEVLKKHHNADT